MPLIEIAYDSNTARARSSYPFLAEDLGDILSYWVKGFKWMSSYKKHHWDGKRHLYHAKSETFPAGLVPRVKEFFEGRDFEVKLYDSAVEPDRHAVLDDYTFVGPDMRDSQEEAVSAALDAGRGTFEAATGWGKTNLMSYLVGELGVPQLCLFHRNELALATQQRFRETLHFPHAKDPFGFIGGGKWEPGLITCASFPTLVSMLARDKKGTMEWLSLFGGLHVDECHHVPAKTLQHLLDATRGAYYRYGYSATPGKDGDKGAIMELEAWIGPVIYSFGVDKAIDAGILAPPHIYMVNPNFPDIPGHDFEGKFMEDFNAEYKAGIEEHKPRNHLVAAHAEASAVHGLPTLVLVQRIEQGRQLSRFITEVETRFVWGATPTDERKAALSDLESGRLPLLIASSIFDEGVDVPAIGALSVAGGYQASHKTLQRVGRGLRASPGKTHVKVYDYWDGHAEHLERHSKTRLKTYRSKKFDVQIVSPAQLDDLMKEEGFWLG